MYRRFLLVLLVCTGAAQAISQKYFTRDGRVEFLSEAPLETIEAINTSGMCVWDSESGALEFQILVKSFRFEKALMEEHFNENYMESEKHPKALFKGQLEDPSAVDPTKDGTYTTRLSGELSMHGVTNPVSSEVTFAVSGDSIVGSATFEVAVADYDIKIPKLVKDNISKVVEIKVEADFKPLDK